MAYFAKPCGCGHKSCKNWHVSGVADVQGVGFTKDQAELVSMVLNLMEDPASPSGWWLTSPRYSASCVS